MTDNRRIFGALFTKAVAAAISESPAPTFEASDGPGCFVLTWKWPEKRADYRIDKVDIAQANTDLLAAFINHVNAELKPCAS